MHKEEAVKSRNKLLQSGRFVLRVIAAHFIFLAAFLLLCWASVQKHLRPLVSQMSKNLDFLRLHLLVHLLL